MATSYIYEIWIGDYFYQGSTVNIRRRINKHLNTLKKNKHDNRFMQNVYNKYQSFEYRILVECSDAAVLQYEQDYIDANWGDQHYLNLNSVAGRPPSCKGKKGHVPSAETRRRISEAHKGRKLSDEHKAKIADKASNISDETRQKMSSSKKGKPRSAEVCAKMSATMKERGRKPSAEAIEATAAAHRKPVEINGIRYASIKEAAECIGFPQSSLTKCLAGDMKWRDGLSGRYITEID